LKINDAEIDLDDILGDVVEQGEILVAVIGEKDVKEEVKKEENVEEKDVKEEEKGNRIMVWVKSLVGTTRIIDDLLPSNTVQELKSKIKEKEGAPIEQQR